MLVAKRIDRVRFSILLIAAAVLIGQATILTASDQKVTSSKAKSSSEDAWETPDEMPQRLSDSLSQVYRVDKYRSTLSKSIEAEYKSASLVKGIRGLQETLDTPFTIALSELDLLGIDHDTPVSIKVGKMPVGEILDLLSEPLNLTYGVRSTGVSIASRQTATLAPTTRFSEKSWAIDSQKDVRGPVNLVKLTVEQDSWVSNGQLSSAIPLGPVLVLSAPSSTQHKIENLLANSAKLKQLRQKRKSLEEHHRLD